MKKKYIHLSMFICSVSIFVGYIFYVASGKIISFFLGFLIVCLVVLVKSYIGDLIKGDPVVLDTGGGYYESSAYDSEQRMRERVLEEARRREEEREARRDEMRERIATMHWDRIEFSVDDYERDAYAWEGKKRVKKKKYILEVEV